MAPLALFILLLFFQVHLSPWLYAVPNKVQFSDFLAGDCISTGNQLADRVISWWRHQKSSRWSGGEIQFCVWAYSPLWRDCIPILGVRSLATTLILSQRQALSRGDRQGFLFFTWCRGPTELIPSLFFYKLLTWLSPLWSLGWKKRLPIIVSMIEASILNMRGVCNGPNKWRSVFLWCSFWLK